MAFVKQWCLCVCISLVFAVIFSLFTPRGNMKSFYRILISFFVFISVLYPLKNIDLKAFNFDKNIIAESENNTAPYSDMINKKITETLESKGITGASVSSDVSIDYSTYEISIDSVKVAVSDGYDKNEVKKIIFDSLGINAEVRGIGD